MNDDKFTQEEMTLFTKGSIMLAIAVVNQWVKDGCPKGSRDGIEPWLQIIKDFQKEQDEKRMKQSIKDLTQ